MTHTDVLQIQDMEEMDKESAAMHKDVKRRVMQLREIQGRWPLRVLPGSKNRDDVLR